MLVGHAYESRPTGKYWKFGKPQKRRSHVNRVTSEIIYVSILRNVSLEILHNTRETFSTLVSCLTRGSGSAYE